MWRVLLRVEKITSQFAHIIIPSWNEYEAVAVPLFSIPQNVRGILKPGMHLHAKVNTNVDESVDLCFSDWEIE